MTDFTTRIELHDGTERDYEVLDGAMEGLNFARVVRSKRGIEYRMPSATYFSQSFNMSAPDVRNLATAAANATGRRFDIVTTSGEVAYFLHPAA